MKPRRKITIAIIVLLVAVGTPFLFSELRRGNPKAYYHGKSAAYWLNEYRLEGADFGEASQAFHEMGTNAYPILIEAIVGNNGASSASQSSKPWLASIPYLGRFFHRPIYYMGLRSAGQVILLNTYKPEMFQLLKQTNSAVQSAVLAAVANKIGPANRDQVPILLALLQDREPGIREPALDCLGGIGSGASAAIPAVSQACQDANPRMRLDAAWALWRITHQTNTAVPALRSVLAQTNGTSQWQLRWAACYLENMGQRDASLIPIFIESLTNSDTGLRTSAAYCLAPFGSAAKAAVPNLLIGLHDANLPELREAAKTALKAIDPETAAAVIPH